MKKTMILIVLLVLLASEGFYIFNTRTTPPPSLPQNITTLTYTDTTHNFSLELPKDWKGYTLVPGTIQFGEIITLRHPLWTKENPYMDIPILIYPIAQWQVWEKNNFEGYPTAAPMGPTERGRNAKYVFATAPRYNYSFAPGWETVDTIVESLKGF